MKFNNYRVTGLIILMLGALLFVFPNISPLATVCTYNPYTGEYCYDDGVRQETTNTLYQTFTTSITTNIDVTVIERVTSYNTRTNTVTEIRAVYLTTTITLQTFNKVTVTNTITNTVTDMIAEYTTTTETITDSDGNIEVVTSTDLISGSLIDGFDGSTILAVSLMILGAGVFIVGSKQSIGK